MMTDLPTMELPDPDPTLLKVLREWRMQRARDENVPPYVVMTNGVMEQIAALRPTCEDELLALKGMGPGRMERYGSDLLALIRSVPLDPVERPDPQPPPAAAPPALVPERGAGGRRARHKREALEDLTVTVFGPHQLSDVMAAAGADVPLGLVPEEEYDHPPFGRNGKLRPLVEPQHDEPPYRRNARRRPAPDPIEISDATPFTVAIEYRISEEIRQKLVSELEESRGPASLGLCRVLEAGPAQMTLRVQWQS